MLRPFKNIEEFKEKTGLGIGYTVSVRLNQDVFPPEFYLHECVITGFNYGDKTICIGGRTYSLEILNKYEYLKDGKWLPFGIEEMDIFKFKIGKYYLGSKGTYIKILNRYTDKNNREHVEIQDFDTRNCPTGWTGQFCLTVTPLDPNDRERCIEVVCGHVTPNRDDEVWRAENECEKIKVLPTIRRPAKFKVGKKYYYFDDSYDEWETTITARYKDPLDGRIKVVFDGKVCVVNTEDDTEWLDEPFMDNVVKATDEVKE